MPVEVVVGPEMGLSYVAENRASPKRLAEFRQVVDIETAAGEGGKASVSIRISAASEPLVVTCPSLAIAESLADLVDGYQILTTQGQGSVWSKRGAPDSHSLQSLLPLICSQLQARHVPRSPQWSSLERL